MSRAAWLAMILDYLQRLPIVTRRGEAHPDRWSHTYDWVDFPGGLLSNREIVDAGEIRRRRRGR